MRRRCRREWSAGFAPIIEPAKVVIPPFFFRVGVPTLSFQPGTNWLIFAFAAMNLLLLQLSAEGGWATGFESVSGRANAGYEPEDGSLFLSIAARLTL